ncbi:MAG: patatin-like phospholipase family protein, partial [Candidatus Eremiobacteraeota bacterium]|nr:patatin-like phospholipase family protein [Candidatus Eremiobacteraeota bacterium]
MTGAPQFVAADFESPGVRRLCDVVMKGGVTSGVVYPTAICRLATTYVIKNIGGTSVGAIAAAITAAAEFRRRKSNSGQGYAELAKLPGFLGAPRALLSLFKPDPIARPLFNVAMIPIGHASPAAKLLRLIGTLLWQYFWIPLLTIAVIFGTFVGVAWPLPPGVLWRCLG